MAEKQGFMIYGRCEAVVHALVKELAELLSAPKFSGVEVHALDALKKRITRGVFGEIVQRMCIYAPGADKTNIFSAVSGLDLAASAAAASLLFPGENRAEKASLLFSLVVSRIGMAVEDCRIDERSETLHFGAPLRFVDVRKLFSANVFLGWIEDADMRGLVAEQVRKTDSRFVIVHKVSTAFHLDIARALGMRMVRVETQAPQTVPHVLDDVPVATVEIAADTCLRKVSAALVSDFDTFPVRVANNIYS